jgi:uncharacterized membrane protein
MAKTNHVVIAYFAGKDQAATAADELMDWDQADDAIKLGGIGVLTWKNSKIQTHKLSRVKAGRGAKWGLALGAVAGILSGGVTLVGGAAAGAAVGAVGAKLFHQSLGLSDADQARLEQRLGIGQAALVVMATEADVEPTKRELAALGGEVEDYAVPAETMEQVEAATQVEPVAEAAPAAIAVAAAAEAPSEPEAPRVVRMPGTLESVEGIGPAYVAALKGIGIGTKRRLLLAGATPEGRAKIAEETKISEKLIAKWVSAIDLSRISGVKAQNSELLVAADVPTVGRLAEQEAGELHDRLVALNAQKKLTRLVPGAAQLGKWIEEAKGLPQMVTM